MRVRRGEVAWLALAQVLSAAACLIVAGAGNAFPQGAAGAPPPPRAETVPAAAPGRGRLRPLKAGTFDATELVTVAIRRSATIRGVAASLEASDVIVWIAIKDEPRLRTGRLRLMGSAGGVRRVYVEIARVNHLDDQVVWLGHELWHALEIARAAEVVDAAGLERLYRRIGDRGLPGESAFETAGAVDAGRRVSRELRMAGRSPQERPARWRYATEPAPPASRAPS
jgi:hypothetical protein